jgi:hypothetical protein
VHLKYFILIFSANDVNIFIVWIYFIDEKFINCQPPHHKIGWSKYGRVPRENEGEMGRQECRRRDAQNMFVKLDGK